MKEVVLDLETEKEFSEVGGKQNMHLLGISVVGIYAYETDTFRAYEKQEFTELEGLLKDSSILIGFNIKHFDIPVLEPYMSWPLGGLTVLDLMEDVERALGFRVSLDNLSRSTLNAGKSGMGLEAIQWWREGKKDKVKEYCLQDVKLTRDLYEFGKREGYVSCQTRDKGLVRLPVYWKKMRVAPRHVLEDALKKRVSVEIEYAADSKTNPTKRKVDIYTMSADTFEGYCHLRQGKRIFQIDRIVGAVLTGESYQLEHDVQRSLI